MDDEGHSGRLTLGLMRACAAAAVCRSEASQCDDHKAEPGGCMGVVFFRLYHDPSLDDYDGFNASTYRTPFDAWGQVETPRVHLGNDTHGKEREKEGGREGEMSCHA